MSFHSWLQDVRSVLAPNRGQRHRQGQGSTRSAAHRQRLLQTGKVGRATILEVHDTGITVNKSPRARIKVRIQIPGEAPIEATTGMFVSRVSPPRTGETYDVRFDPRNPNDFVFEERASIPQSRSEDRISQLERLGQLRDKGVLTQAEFEAEKKKLLG